MTCPHVTTPPRPPGASSRRRRWWALTAAGLVALAVLITGVPFGGHRELTGREWQLLAADPAAHAGEQVVVFGVVTTPGAGTERGLVRAAVDGLDRADGFPTLAELHGADPGLEAGDRFRADVTVQGPAGEDVVLQVDRMRVLERAG